MTETSEVLSTLKRLQEVDKKLAHLRRMKEYEPRRLAKAEQIAGQAEKLFGELDKEHGDLERKVALLELDIKSREEKINRHKGQMLSASSNKEYQALLHEISLDEVEKSRVEDELLDVMVKIDSFAQREAEVKQRIAEAKRELDVVRSEVEASVKEIASDEAGLRAERAEIAAKLPADVLRQYDRLFYSRNGEAVVGVTYQPGSARTEGRYVCDGCNMSMTHQIVNLLLIGNEVVHCNSCGRILYLDQAAEAEGDE